MNMSMYYICMYIYIYIYKATALESKFLSKEDSKG